MTDRSDTRRRGIEQPRGIGDGDIIALFVQRDELLKEVGEVREVLGEYTGTGTLAQQVRIRLDEAYTCGLRDGAEEAYERLDGTVMKALGIAAQYGTTDGGDHRMWVIDQMVRALTGDSYSQWVQDMEYGEDGPHTYEWEEGIAP